MQYIPHQPHSREREEGHTFRAYHHTAEKEKRGTPLGKGSRGSFTSLTHEVLSAREKSTVYIFLVSIHTPLRFFVDKKGRIRNLAKLSEDLRAKFGEFSESCLRRSLTTLEPVECLAYEKKSQPCVKLHVAVLF